MEAPDRLQAGTLRAQFDELLERLRAAADLPEHLADDLARFAEDLGELRSVRALAHDLRAPIGALAHQAQLLADPTLPEDLRAQSAAALQDNAAALGAMLDDLDRPLP